MHMRDRLKRIREEKESNINEKSDKDLEFSKIKYEVEGSKIYTICHSCPNHCNLTIIIEGENIDDILGNRCYKGVAFAREIYNTHNNL